ncbi:MAG: hypothetical protein PHT99_07985 [Methanoregula sp.]|nr:hypothetical protein [Methanoregula sp.]
MIQIPQLILAGLFITMLTGASAVSFRWQEIPTLRDFLQRGTIAGTAMGVVAGLIITNAGIISGTASFLGVIPWIVLMIVISMPGTISGAYLCFRSQPVTKQPSERGFGKKQIRFTLRLVVIGLIIVLLLPPALAFAGTKSGMIGNDCSECRIHQDVHAERITNQSVQITYTSKVPPVPWIGPYEPTTIILDGIDISNQSSINKQGIACRIEPGSGLTYDTVSTVILRGGALNADGSHMAHIIVISHYGSPSGMILFDNPI